MQVSLTTLQSKTLFKHLEAGDVFKFNDFHKERVYIKLGWAALEDDRFAFVDTHTGARYSETKLTNSITFLGRLDIKA